MEGVMTELIDCVGVICFRGEDVLLIKRGTAPRKGEWSIPGGRIEASETQRDAALRELFEETGIMAALENLKTIITAFMIMPRVGFQANQVLEMMP